MKLVSTSEISRIILELNETFCGQFVPYDFPLDVLHTK